ncbi:hypothetical protein [Salipiger sp.]|uniref:hypothetical protein n=1 Tax=Salipiger sp. TaxID=2078585 RepID=UPI003A985684
MTQPIQPSYPAVQFLIRYGGYIASALGVLPALAGLVMIAAGFSAWWLLGGLAVSPVLYLLARSYIELVRIIGDTLLPR